MTIIGILGLFVNLIDATILAWGKASHSHGHPHSHPNDENINVKSAFVHVVGDCVQSMGVIFAAVFIWVGNQLTVGSPKSGSTYWILADPIASILFGIITLFTTG
eukprot:TRINITY_DN11743_c0_g1_i1.p1 TRINITY_DN11743_c0_g1~~TRINITY_DN11743_c0_g1_i1.p1  ORF type:complete len:105 (-),score=5.70 TRINITY_DN11743_c0_g1_i1:37-351(-)